ncbi:MAG: GNAT family N-acetyltransferase [Bacilli bacterium]|nr:GNAT family N-acetyltransferase [Bacilli bacterium]
MPNDVTLSPYQPDHQQAFKFYPLTLDHLEFTTHPLELLKNNSQASTPVTILAGNQIAGFFVLDVSDDRYSFTGNPNSVLLRGYSIHPDIQGQGIAKASFRELPSFILQNFPQYNEVVLGVNDRNEAARAVYLKSGFIDEGRRYNGSKGVQWALHLYITKGNL